MSKRILIIDDDRIIQDSLQEHFSAAGYSVSVASDGVSGFEMLVRERPDAVVADILLPRMHGVALCEKIRASEEFGQVPIILMTGVYKDVNLRMYVHKGLADDFIEKPFREKELIDKVERLLGRRPQNEESQTRSAPVAQGGQKGQGDRSPSRDLDDLVNWARGKGKK
jgi:two-component system alkaline phosphatase synthesis response regulator PhoP